MAVQPTEVGRILQDEQYEVAHTKEASREDVARICEEFKEVPLADVLVDIFLKEADAETFRIGEDEWGKREILADVKGKEFPASLRIRNVGKDSVDLEIYDNEMKEIPVSGNVFCQEIVTFSAMEVKEGTWVFDKGDRYTYGIHVRFYSFGLTLPSDRGAWALGVVSDLAKRASELHASIGKQPRFYLSTEPRPEPR